MATIVVAYVDKPEGRAALRRAADEAVGAMSACSGVSGASGAGVAGSGVSGAAGAGVSGGPDSGGARGSRVVVIDGGPIETGTVSGVEGAERRSDGLGEIIAELGDAGVDCEVRTLVPGDDLADDVLGTAEALTADLIVIGLRRRSPVGKLMLGTNAQRILLDASCPVLTVKAADPAATDPTTGAG